MSLVIRNVTVDGATCTLRIRDGHIAAIEPGTTSDAAAEPTVRVIDGTGLHAFPSLKNAHTHVAMVLFRGYGDDMPLMDWLRTRIWPAERHLTEEDVYRGARLGILEMIRGGTTFFNEMYWHRPGIVRAVDELGVRAVVGQTLIDIGDAGTTTRQQQELVRLLDTARTEAADRVHLAAAPHSIYTVTAELLAWVGALAREHDLLVHIHLAETQGEVDECLRTHGCRPAQLLARVGLISSNLIAVHGQFLDDDELALLGAAGATLVTNPTANLKLATGGIFPYCAARAAGVRVCLGTDGAASNNNLDMLEEMKIAALVQKHRERDATVLPAAEALAMATSAASAAFRLGGGGIDVGAPADLMLVDFDTPATQPLHDPVSSLVYAAQAAQVHTTICAGRVLMYDRRVEVCDEQEVIADAVATVRRLLGHAKVATAIT
jgi:5-methylthioadenosine/S-adenosylhomocysteine deaminase